MEVKIGKFSVRNINNFISSLFIDSKSRPVGVDGKNKGNFEIQIESRFEASGGEGDVIVEDTREGFVGEVKEFAVSNGDGGVDIIDFVSRVFSKVDG